VNHIMPMAKAYSYTRFSTPEQAAGDSFRRQTEAARTYAAAHGFQLDEGLSLSDLGVSAFHGANQADDAGLGRFKAAIKLGLIEPGSVLLIESLDRLSRGVPRRTVRLLEEIVDAGVTVVTLSDGQRYDANRLDTDPTALIVALMVAVRAHEESATKGRRVAAAWAEKRRKVRAGEVIKLTERAPAWLRWDAQAGRWEVDERRADIVRRVYVMTLEGQGEHRIAETLNREGVPPLGRAKLWHRSSVAKLLRNPAVIGHLTPGRIEHVDGRKVRAKEEPIPDAFPAIIDEADWLAVRSLKDGHAPATRGRGSKQPLANVFAGLARCPRCGSAMTRVNKGSRKKAGRPYLVCTRAKAGAGCCYRAVPLEDAERGLFDHAAHFVEDVPAGDGNEELDAQIGELAASIAGMEDHYADLAEAKSAAGSSALVATRLAKLGCEIETAKAALEALNEQRRCRDGGLIRERAVALAAALRDFDGANREPINAAMRVLFDGVTVDYERGRLAFHWRQGGETAIPYAYGFEPHEGGFEMQTKEAA
jgi:DNA invertase Pin-like site-specific DNA recombinase